MKKLSYNNTGSEYYAVKGVVNERRMRDGKTLLVFENEENTSGFCLNCDEKFCMKYNDAELTSKTFADFPNSVWEISAADFPKVFWGISTVE